MINLSIFQSKLARLVAVCTMLLIVTTISSFAARWVRVGVINAATNSCFWVLVEDNETSNPQVLGFTQFDCNSTPHRTTLCSNGLTVEQNIKKHLPNLDYSKITISQNEKRTFSIKDCKVVFEARQELRKLK